MGFLNNLIKSVLEPLKDRINRPNRPNDKDLYSFFIRLQILLEDAYNANDMKNDMKKLLKACQELLDLGDKSAEIMIPIISEILKLMDDGISLEEAMKKTNVFPRYICDLMQTDKEITEKVNEILLSLEKRRKRQIDALFLALTVMMVMCLMWFSLIVASIM